MSVIFLLIPLSILVAAGFLGAFIWAVRSGQYEDTCTPSLRLLVEDRQGRAATPAVRGGEATGDRAGSPATGGAPDRPSGER